MTDNFMEKIAEVMGMKIGDKFSLYYPTGEKVSRFDFLITENGIYDDEGYPFSMDEAEAFFAGRFEKESDIDRKLRNIEEELEIMTLEVQDLTEEIKGIKEQMR